MVRHIVSRNAIMRLSVRIAPLVERPLQAVALLGRGCERGADLDKLRVQLLILPQVLRALRVTQR